MGIDMSYLVYFAAFISFIVLVLLLTKVLKNKSALAKCSWIFGAVLVLGCITVLANILTFQLNRHSTEQTEPLVADRSSNNTEGDRTAVNETKLVQKNEAVSTNSTKKETISTKNGYVKFRGLTWMRCSLGQKLDGSHCTGKPKQIKVEQVSSIKAKSKSGAKFEGYDDWRLPTISELRSLLDCSQTLTASVYLDDVLLNKHRPVEGDCKGVDVLATGVIATDSLGYFWSDETIESYNDHVFYAVNLANGDIIPATVNGYKKTSSGHEASVRLVRSDKGTCNHHEIRQKVLEQLKNLVSNGVDFNDDVYAFNRVWNIQKSHFDKDKQELVCLADFMLDVHLLKISDHGTLKYTVAEKDGEYVVTVY